MPPVFSAVAVTHVAIDSSDRTSSCNVSIPRSLKCEILSGFRAVAITLSPFLWNACANASPRAPFEQPVIRTVRFVGVGEVDMMK